MTAPDSFAAAADATAYGYTLPASPDGLLARATQVLRDEAGIPITETSSQLVVPAWCGNLDVPNPLITAVTAVALVNDDDTTTPVTDWTWRGGRRICLGPSVSWHDRHHGRFQVDFTHGFASIPPSLVRLTCAVAARLAVTPPAAMAGLSSRTVGSVSWTARETPDAVLTENERRALALIVPVRHAWQVPV